MEMCRDRGGSKRRQRQQYVETEAEVHGDGECISITLFQ
jgi:hypothetical protein